MCCVGDVGAMMRGAAVSRTVTAAVLATMATASVCAYHSQCKIGSKEQGIGNMEQGVILNVKGYDSNRK